jgi:4,5-DOPA dioxygenase extradiol
MKFPVLYLCHGGPDTLMHPDSAVYKFWKNLSSFLPAKPKNILIFSGHYQTTKKMGVGVMTSEKPEQIYDFGGFDDSLYEIKYKCKNDTVFAKNVQDLLSAKGIKTFGDDEAGYDHGCWVPLSLSFPDADIPVTLVSTLQNDPETNISIGRALQKLRDEQTLIFCSGHLVHNLAGMFGNDMVPNEKKKEYASSFNAAIHKLVGGNSTDNLVSAMKNWKEIPGAQWSVGRSDDHFSPFLVACGAASESNGKDPVGNVLYCGKFLDFYPQNVFLFN